MNESEMFTCRCDLGMYETVRSVVSAIDSAATCLPRAESPALMRPGLREGVTIAQQGFNTLEVEKYRRGGDHEWVGATGVFTGSQGWRVMFASDDVGAVRSRARSVRARGRRASGADWPSDRASSRVFARLGDARCYCYLRPLRPLAARPARPELSLRSATTNISLFHL